MKQLDMVGKRFGRLLVISAATPKRGAIRWNCKCDCGTEKIVIGSDMIRGHTSSCGCLHKERFRQSNIIHGETVGHKLSVEYKTWHKMIERCYDVKNNRYKDYGGRGIKVCDRWLSSLENFIADMGRKPSSELSIDRINNDGNYEPGNCRWATRSEQMRNRRPRKLRKAS